MPKEWPGILYHYTSSHALISILQSRCIWLSGRWNLNDTDEGAVFRRHLQSYAESESLDGSNVERVLAELASFESYVSCFSSKGDMLSQWRGYANNGTGVSIGFNTSSLIGVIDGGSVCLLQKVAYADKVEDLTVETKSLMKALLTRKGEPGLEFKQSAAKVMWAIKNSAFAEEDEYRLILTSLPGARDVALPSGASAKLKHRPTDAGIREYYELSLGPRYDTAISEIILGPKNDSHVDVVQRFLASVGLPDVPVRKSVATYR
ncbi:DUF2971 domain-containing protein [Sorangium sp. So ce1335]|uniref:DUF2971 domain-containing protein n=1 Tax=Sorangium sp. So ce1335 TaxID=3133335 RepID=UPI003F631F92